MEKAPNCTIILIYPLLVFFCFACNSEVESDKLEFAYAYLGGRRTDAALDVIETKDGGLFVTGVSSSFTNGSEDILYYKVNGNWKVEWAHVIGQADGDTGVDAIESAKGGYYVTGHSKFPSDSTYDIFLSRLDETGDTMWCRTLGGTNDDYGTSLLEMDDGSVILSGYTYSYGVGQDDVFLIKFNEFGDTLWTKIYGGLVNEHSYTVRKNNKDQLLLGGFTKSFKNEYYDVYLLKTDLKGDTIWTGIYGAEGHDRLHSIENTQDGGLIIAGSTESFGAGKMDLFLLKLDDKGDIEWTKVYGTVYPEMCRSLEIANDGTYMISGATSYPETGDNDFIFIHTDKNGEPIEKYCWGSSLSEKSWEVVQNRKNEIVLAGQGVMNEGEGYKTMIVGPLNEPLRHKYNYGTPIMSESVVFEKQKVTSFITRGLEIKHPILEFKQVELTRERISHKQFSK